MKIAVTGTRMGMSHSQWMTFRQLLDKQLYLITEAHLGDCIGADADAHKLITEMVQERALYIELIGHIPDKDKTRAFCKYTREMPPLPYKVRDRNMVDACDHLYAFPKGYVEEMRGSGTWLTVRYARKIGRPLTIIWPNGNTVEESALVPLFPEV